MIHLLCVVSIHSRFNGNLRIHLWRSSHEQANQWKFSPLIDGKLFNCLALGQNKIVDLKKKKSTIFCFFFIFIIFITLIFSPNFIPSSDLKSCAYKTVISIHPADMINSEEISDKHNSSIKI